MVAVVQLVEHQVVILGVAGSSPVSHPKVKARPAQRGPGFSLAQETPGYAYEYSCSPSPPERWSHSRFQ